MILWLDAQLSPAIASWIATTFSIECVTVRDPGMRDAKDPAIFQAAREAGSVVMTKDQDLVELLERLGSPPSVIWLTCGNTSNARVREILKRSLPAALRLIQPGEPLIEIGDQWSSDRPANENA